MALLALLPGCAHIDAQQQAIAVSSNSSPVSVPTTLPQTSLEKNRTRSLVDSTSEVVASYSPPLVETDQPESHVQTAQAVEPLPEPLRVEELQQRPIELSDVVTSIHASYPLLEVAYRQTQIANGNQLAAWGEFDTKLKAASENGPLGFYQTYRNQMGLVKPVYSGGEVFAGYRIGRGEFQPWYLERQTNDGGEFKAGLNIPLLRGNEIDARRADLWRATYDRQRTEPEIQAQLISFVFDGSLAYWQWISAVRKYEIATRALVLAQKRNAQIERRVDLGDVEPPVLQDNLRAIAQREAKLIELRRKLQQSAFKLSLFYRTADGMPAVPDIEQFHEFPDPISMNDAQLDRDLEQALTQRPEIAVLQATIRRIQVDLAEYQNDMLPTVNLGLTGSQDVGGPTSSKRDKSPFELEAGLYIDMPVQRRKAQGKLQASQGKLGQLNAKLRFTSDKIRTELQASYAAISAAFEKLGKAQESKRLAEYLGEVERRKFELGESDLLSVVLREQYAIEAAVAEVDAYLEYYSAKAFYDAAMARDWPE